MSAVPVVETPPPAPEAPPDTSWTDVADTAPVDETTKPARRGPGRILVMASWMYLTAHLCLLGWVIVPALLLGWSPHVIYSGSMSPKIAVGEVVLTTPPPDAVLETGTIVMFRYAGTNDLITHRVVGIETDGSYRTQGDANPTPDPQPLPAEEVEGVGRLLVPMIGLPAAWLHNGDTIKFAAWTSVTFAAIVVAPGKRIVHRGGRRGRSS